MSIRPRKACPLMAPTFRGGEARDHQTQMKIAQQRGMGALLTNSVGVRGQPGRSGKAASEEVAFQKAKEERERDSESAKWVCGRGKSQCKGPGAAMCLALKKNNNNKRSVCGE